MLGLVSDHRRRRNSPEIIFRCIISVIFGIFTQLSLLIIPHYFGFFSLLTQLFLLAGVLLIAIVFGQIARRLLRIRASAPAFVLFHIIFIWLVYICVIRRAVSPLMNLVFNGELAILLMGYFRMLTSDPGFVYNDSPGIEEVAVSQDGFQSEEVTLSEIGKCLEKSTEEASLSSTRIRFCKSCKVHVMGFDHHCPAFGNCIGGKNYALFMVLLVGFILTEALYAVFSHQWMKRNDISTGSRVEVAQNLASSTMLFSLFQVLWQVVFLAWHIYCACFNIRTDEWINWRRYPEFQVIIEPPSGGSSAKTRFRNPYHNGILRNLKETLLT